MTEQKQTNMFKYMSNPRAFTLKKWFYDLLKINYSSHDVIIERVAASLTTDKDLEDFSKLIGQVYEMGYRRAVSDYQNQVEELGLRVQVVNPEESN